MDVLTILGALATAIAGVGGTYAVIQARRTESKSASREETELALKAQNDLLDRYEVRIEMLEGKVTRMETIAEDAVAARNQAVLALEDMSLKHKDCEERLSALEERLE
jgi:hypothetical protein